MSTMMIPMLPESAPFTPQQRSWLNGFFAGLLSPTQGGRNGAGVAPVNGNGSAGVATPQAAEEEEEDFPWHDPAMPMDERMRLAEPKPFNRKLMAAMAQLDCGACGYLCKSYAEAIAGGAERDLSLCQPGGKPTAVKLKELVASRPKEEILEVKAVTVAGANGSTLTPALSLGGRGSGSYSRDNPYPAPLVANTRLNKEGSAKDTRFIAVDIAGSGLKYESGDSLGVWPENCFEHVDAILRLLDLTGAELITTRDSQVVPLRQAMIREFDVASASPEVLDLLKRCAKDKEEIALLDKLMDDQPIDGLVDNPHLIDVFARFPSARPAAQELAGALRRLRPRLYSISSSPKAYPNEVHLTVGIVRYEMDGRRRKGVASTYLSDRVLPRQPVRVFVNPSHGFRPPSDPNAGMIMIGPGTGIAPFRAFLQERAATGAKGKNWLFFGDQRGSTDFLYQDELEHWQTSGLLTRIDTAFSRDSDAKVYVQHRMLEQADELWAWLEAGAGFYVCGDAKRMAADVDRALHAVIEQHIGSAEKAKAFVAEMSKSGRYQRDVY